LWSGGSGRIARFSDHLVGLAAFVSGFIDYLNGVHIGFAVHDLGIDKLADTALFYSGDDLGFAPDLRRAKYLIFAEIIRGIGLPQDLHEPVPACDLRPSRPFRPVDIARHRAELGYIFVKPRLAVGDHYLIIIGRVVLKVEILVFIMPVLVGFYGFAKDEVQFRVPAFEDVIFHHLRAAFFYSRIEHLAKSRPAPAYDDLILEFVDAQSSRLRKIRRRRNIRARFLMRYSVRQHVLYRRFFSRNAASRG